jgi:hypothetical protein
VIRIAIVLAWLAMAAWLVRYEAYPTSFTHTLGGYSDLLPRDTLISESWMRILRDGRPVGYARTTVDVDDGDPTRHIEYENRTHLKLDVFGSTQVVSVLATAWLNVMRQLQAFEFSLKSNLLNADVSGQRNEGGTFDIIIRSGETDRAMTVAIPDDVIVHSPFTSLALRNLGPGRTLTVHTLNPVTMTREAVTLRGEGDDTIRLDGEPVKAQRVSVTYGGTDFSAWIDRDGNLLRQETPFGWTLERADADTIFESMPPGTNTATESSS